MEAFFEWVAKFSSSTFLNNMILLGGVLATLRVIKTTRVATLENIESSRKLAKQTETALLMFNSRTDDMLRAGYRTIRELHRSNSDNIVAYATDASKRASEQADQIRYVLNHWERIAVCIGHGIYCEDILKDSMFTTVVNVYDQAEPFIKALRREAATQTIYQDFERLAARWRQAPLKHRLP